MGAAAFAPMASLRKALTTCAGIAKPTSGPVMGNGILEIDASGAQRWDRNNDGDFGDTNETGWGH